MSSFEFEFSCRVLKSILEFSKSCFEFEFRIRLFSFRCSIRFLEFQFSIRVSIRVLSSSSLNFSCRILNSSFSFRCSIRFLEFRCSSRFLEFRCSSRFLEVRLLDSSPLNFEFVFLVVLIYSTSRISICDFDLRFRFAISIRKFRCSIRFLECHF